LGRLERGEQGVVVEPGRLGPLELLERLAQLAARPVAERLPGPVKQPLLVLGRVAVIDLARREVDVVQVRRRDQTVADEVVGTDEVGAAGERRVTLVRRVAVAGRAERQYLPPRLFVPGERLDPGVSDWPEVADAVATRERRGMEQNAGRAAL
jgi:hypothetical protein